MKVAEITKILDAKLLTFGADLDRDVQYAFASDLMSDVLTRDYENTLLITGLSNIQSIRTAEISDISFVCVARNKEVTQEMIAIAAESNIVLMTCKYSVFRVSGLLYEAGIKYLF